MISEEDLRETARNLLGDLADPGFPYGEVSNELNDYGKEHNIRLSPYGFLMWAVEHHGFKCAYRNLLASQQVVRGYADEARKIREDMPSMLVNAHLYVTKIMSNVADMGTCFRQLEGMTFPYVLYVLFAGSGQREAVERYRPEMEEQLKRYPSTLDLLPESYRKVGEDMLHADAK